MSVDDKEQDADSVKDPTRPCQPKLKKGGGYSGSGKPPKRRWWWVVLGLIGAFLFGASQDFVGGLAVEGTKILSQSSGGAVDEMKTFGDVAIAYRRAYHREPLSRFVTIDAYDDRGREWLGRWAGFNVPDIQLGELGDEIGYEFEGFAHYPWAEKRVVVGTYRPKNVEANAGPIFVCLIKAGDSSLTLGGSSGFSRDTNFGMAETTSRHDGKRIFMAAVGATSNTDLENLLKQVTADF